MPQGNTSLSEGGGTSELYVSLVKSGAAFSGGERHCAFLNQGDGRFATVSAISGLDFPDDGRAAAWTDWDGDGDLDLWVSNRSGPQLRFLRNDLTSKNTFLSLHLEGSECNRDAVGARLEVYLKGRTAPLVRTLRVGSGFLAQSSKWIHFGLGPGMAIERLVVRWPGGGSEEFSELKAGERYQIIQGEATPRLIKKRDTHLQVSEIRGDVAPSPVHVLSHSLTPLPKLSYADWKGKTQEVFSGTPGQPGSPVLLNLWASWCAPCVSELGEFAQRFEELQREGLEVVALSVDGAGGDSANAKRLVSELKLPFPTGIADQRLVEKLQLVHNMAFDFHQILTVPCSILIDPHGRMSAIYKGPVDVDRVLADLKRYDLREDERRAASLPFSGRWFAPPRPLHLFNLAWQLFERDYFDEGIAFYVQNAPRIKGHPKHPDLLLMIGDGCLQDGKEELAATMYQEALRERPGWAVAQQRLDQIKSGLLR